MNERLIEVAREDLREDDEVVQTDAYRAKWRGAGGLGPIESATTTYQRVERDPELPTKSGAVIWAALRNRCKPLALQLGDRNWHGTDGCRYAAYEITHVLAVLRDPGADT